jgi:hypothetical protein
VDKVLAVQKLAAKQPSLKLYILRYCLHCPGKRAAAYVAEYRKADREEVEEQEERLRLEGTPKLAAADAVKKQVAQVCEPPGLSRRRVALLLAQPSS